MNSNSSVFSSSLSSSLRLKNFKFRVQVRVWQKRSSSASSSSKFKFAALAVPHDDSNATPVFSSPIFGKNSANQIAQNVAAVYTQIE